jgi:PAS domain S-box-containing protein
MVQVLALLPFSYGLHLALSFYPTVRNLSFAASWRGVIAFQFFVLLLIFFNAFFLLHSDAYELVASLTAFIGGCYSAYVIHVAIKAQRVLMATQSTNDQLIQLVENLPTGAILIEGSRLKMNRATEEISGYSREEIRTLSQWFDAVFGERTPEIAALYQETIKNPGQRPIVPVRRKDGSFRQVMFDGHRGKNWEVWILTDLTDYIINSRKFEVLFQNSSDAYLLYDETGVVDCNPSALGQVGVISKEELLKRHPAEFSPEHQPCGELSAEKARRMDALAMEKGMHSFEWVHQRLSGETFPGSITLIRVELNLRPALFAIWHDLSEQKKNQAQMIMASKMSSLGEMAGGMAHELNNPIAIIKGKAQLLQMDLEDGADLDRAHILAELAAIDSTTDRMSKIIRALKAFSRQSNSSDPFTPVEAREIIDETLSFCASRFRAHAIELEVVLDEGAEIECRKVEVSQVLLNLLNNACDAVAKLPVRWVKLEVKRSGNGVLILVRDSGEGIPPHVAPKIMEPFFTTKPQGAGTGLGLPISKGIIEDHGGELRLLPDAATTTFEIWLPLKQGQKRLTGALAVA